MSVIRNGYFQDHFEGCGQEGPIRCIFLCEFHPTVGPQITCQILLNYDTQANVLMLLHCYLLQLQILVLLQEHHLLLKTFFFKYTLMCVLYGDLTVFVPTELLALLVPENYISKDIFDAVSVYIIPKAQLQRSTLTVTLSSSKILGFPVRIDNKKYARNAFHFNLCIVCDAWSRTVHYEPVLKKLTDYLIAMELENGFLSQHTDKPNKLSVMLKQVMDDLNSHSMCTLTEGTTTTHLKVVRVCADPVPVPDHVVPIFLSHEQDFLSDQWDLTTHQVYPYIDGFNHVAKIAAEADVENNLVKACVQNLVYYGVVALIPIFQYCNVYTATPKLRQLSLNKLLQQRCIDYISVRQPASLRDVFRIYSSMTYGTTVRDLCIRFNPKSMHINERKLVQFGVLEGFIRRVYKYPVVLNESSNGNDDNASNVNQLQNSLTGTCSMDEICCCHGISTQELEDQLECDPSVIMLLK